MILRASPLKPSSYNEVEVFLDKSPSGFSGVICHAATGHRFKFESDVNFVLGIEALLDKQQFPMRPQKIRMFKDFAYNDLKLEGVSDMNDKATFVVKIEHRQNATWQGTVRWMEDNRTENFRSLLELIVLVESAINQDPEQK